MPFFFKQWGGVRKKLAGRELHGRTYDDHPPLIRADMPDRATRKQMAKEFEEARRNEVNRGSLLRSRNVVVRSAKRISSFRGAKGDIQGSAHVGSSNHPETIVCPVRGEFTPCDVAELLPLVEHLEQGLAVEEATVFPRGTVLPDGRVDLCKQNIGPLGARTVARSLPKNLFARHILLGANGIGTAGAKDIAQAVENHPALETVYLGCNLIEAEGAEALAKAIQSHPKVTGLWLKRNPIGLNGARAIARLLQENRTLTTLDLVHTDIGSEGLEILVDVLSQQNRSITRLYLGGNRLGPDEASCLVRLLCENDAIKHLYLSVNRLADEGLERLAQGLTENKVLGNLEPFQQSHRPQGRESLGPIARPSSELKTSRSGL